MTTIEHRFVEVNGIRLHVAEQGEGPLILLLHGFPECWYSWRHQFAPLAEAGYRVVAPDQRGYARSDAPEDVAAYSLLHLVGDVVGLIHALGEERAVVVGHDWGGPVAWTTALLRPDLVRGVAGLSVPPRRRGPVPPIPTLRSAFGDSFYQVYFQRPGVADRELAEDPDGTFRTLLYGASGDNKANASPGPWMIPDGKGVRGFADVPDALPDWLTEEDIAAFVGEFADKGFTGPLNWYRNLDRNWELTAAWADAVVRPPALYIAGERDMVPALIGIDELKAGLPELAPDLRGTVFLPGCGHWTQQERPAEVSKALLDFLNGL
ncbi:alpha/beta fold hydrolase [Streptomyces formicae]|uniref:Alpha/beta hydrolase n=1 Tax=Streptomyces formicae TaxID=1616117 RepID=A0ABY3WLL9_9ACTN|nr:alpha/beta hydrolase [Streptomyces formicae]UNM13517.1 alpha/beta hydrolase [Streptomyces formicae]